MSKFKKFIESQYISNEYEKNKKNWLEDDENNGYLGEETKITYWRIFNSNIFDLERAYNKDIRVFTSVEISNLMKSIVTNTPSTKRTLFSMINNYMIYCVNRGFISYNPCDSIDTEGLFEINTNALRNEYMNLEEFYEYVDKLEADNIQKMIYVLVRYGCPIKSVPEVKYSDVDFENKIINVLIKNKQVSLPVDEEFLNRVNRANACHSMLSSKKDYVESEYLIKNTLTNDKLKVTSIYTIVEKVSNNTNIQRIDMGILYKSRRYDLVMNIESENGRVTTSDLTNVLKILGVAHSKSQVTSFKKEIEDIFNINVEIKQKAIEAYRYGELIAEGGSAQKMADTLSEMGVTISRMTVNNYLKSGLDYNGITFKYKEQD